MILQGKHAKAVVHTDQVEQEAISQIINILNQPMMDGVQVRIMPDVHAGAGICIGYTATRNDFIVPNFIGVDIGCGLTALPLPKDFTPSFEQLDAFIRNHIPSGASVNQKTDFNSFMKPYYDHEFHDLIQKVCKRIGIEEGRVFAAIGSLGGGNHFLSVNRSCHGRCYFVVHSGSRNFGKCIAEYHQRIAAAGGQKPKGLEWLSGTEAKQYFDDMAVAQRHAQLNRRVIIDRIAKFLGIAYYDSNLIESVHNYINFEDGIIRKGAISAHDGEMMLIPLSMADGILYCRGKGNREWNCSAPHGAGRLMSRSKAKQSISVDDYRQRMADAGVWTSCVGESTLDEAPQAYKDSALIIEAIQETADIIDQWQEIYNFKAS